MLGTKVLQIDPFDNDELGLSLMVCLMAWEGGKPFETLKMSWYDSNNYCISVGCD